MDNQNDSMPQALSKPERRKQRIEELKERSARLHRSLLSPRVLRGLLPVRAATTSVRSGSADARDREARFRAGAPAYVRALESDDAAFADRTRVVDLDGLRWWVPLMDPSNEAMVQRYLTHQDFPYRAIVQTREAAVGGIMLDVGANTGRMSIPRVILGDVIAAYCAEPDPLNFHCLVRNVQANGLAGLVLPDNVAISSEPGVVRLQHARTAGGHRVIDVGTASARTTVDVPAVTLDGWTERLGLDPQAVSFVKVDAQGSELHVLRGARRLLACRHIAWQIELDVPLLARRGVTPQMLFDELRTHFTHFVDLSREARGPRLRRMADVAGALEYIIEPRGSRTDILAFSLRFPAGDEEP